MLPVFLTKDQLLSWVKGIVYESLQLGIPAYYYFLVMTPVLEATYVA